MPTTIEDLTTVQLMDIAQQFTSSDYTVAEALAELRVRVVPPTDPATAWRGGIRPNHPNL